MVLSRWTEGRTPVGLGRWRHFGVRVRDVRPVVYVGHHSIFSHLVSTILEKRNVSTYTRANVTLFSPPRISKTFPPPYHPQFFFCATLRDFSGLNELFACTESHIQRFWILDDARRSTTHVQPRRFSLTPSELNRRAPLSRTVPPPVLFFLSHPL